MSDIIEVGDDGCFDIPAPTRIKIVDSDDEVEEESSGFIEDSGFLSYVQDSQQTFKELISDILPGGYKILESQKSNSIIAVIVLDLDEKAEKLSLLGRSIEVETTKNRILSLELPTRVDMRTGTSSSFQNILYLNIKKLKN